MRHCSNTRGNVVGARTRCKGLFNFCIFLCGAKGTSNTDSGIEALVWVDFVDVADFLVILTVLAWPWIHVGLADTEVASDAGSDEVSYVGVVDGNDVGFVFARAGEVQILTHEPFTFEPNMKLWILPALLKVTLDIVSSCTWYFDSRNDVHSF